MADDERRWETLQDDWSEYGSAVQDAYEALVGVQVAKLDTVRKAFEARLVEIGNMDWEQSIEPVYEIFRRKVIEKSRVAYAPNPYIGGSDARSEEHTSELQSLMRISYAVFCLKKKNTTIHTY